jgi:membrane protein YdbS with pleckstrin-like domain
MNAVGQESRIPSDKRERLVLILHSQRASSIFYYVFSVILFIIGLVFMVLTSYGAISRDIDSWALSSSAMIFGVLLFVWAETKHYFTLYIITTWNVRVRKGIFRRRTTRVFYDEITECRTTSGPDEKRVGMGDVEIYSLKAQDKPTLVFDEVHNPDGVREIVSRFVSSIPDPLPWGHLDRT